MITFILNVSKVFNAFCVFLWRIFIVFKEFGKNIGSFYFKYKTELGALFILFVIGTCITSFETECVEAISIAYECGLYKVLEFLQSALNTLITIPFKFLAPKYNDVAEAVVNSIKEFINDIKMIQDIISIGGFAELYTAFYHELKRLLLIFVTTDSIKIPYVSDILYKIELLFFCVTDLTQSMIVSILTLTIINQDCTVCDLDPGKSCSFSQAVAFSGTTFPEPNCAPLICYDFIGEAATCIADLLNFLTVDVADYAIDNVLGSIACFLNTYFKYPLYLVFGLIDGCISLNGSSIGDFLKKYFEEMIHCSNLFIAGITNGTVTNFWDLVFSYLFEFAAVIVHGFEDLIACEKAPDFLSCLNSWPDGTGSGSCRVDKNGYPLQGLHTCFDINRNCIKIIPIFAPLESAGFLSIVPSLTQFLDLIVCPFVKIQTCFSSDYIQTNCSASSSDCTGNTFVSEGICAFQCVETQAPVFSTIADIVVVFLQVIQSIMCGILEVVDGLKTAFDKVQSGFETVANTFACFGGPCIKHGIAHPLASNCGIGEALSCLIRCFKDVGSCGSGISRSFFTKSENDYILPANIGLESDALNWSLNIWQNHLKSTGLDDTTTCGKTIMSYLPNQIQAYHLGDYSNYWMCMTIFHISKNISEESDQSFDMNKLMDYTTFFEGFRSLQYVASKKRNIDKIRKNLDPFIEDKKFPSFNLSSVSSPIIIGMKNYMEKLKNDSSLNPVLFIANTFTSYFEKTVYYDIAYDFYNQSILLRNEYYPKETPYSLQLVDNNKRFNDQTRDEYFKRDSETLYLYFVNKWMNHYHSNEIIRPNKIAQYRKKRMEKMNGGQTKKKFKSQDDEKIDIKRKNEFVNFNRETIRYPLEITYESIKEQKNFIDRILEKSEMAKRIFERLDERYDIKRRDFYQKLHMGFTLLQTKDVKGFYNWINGTKSYLVDKGFVNKNVFEIEMQNKREIPRGSIPDILMGTFTLPEKRKYGMFLTDPSYTLMTLPNLTKAYYYLDDIRISKENAKERDELLRDFRILNSIITPTDNTNFNTYIYNALDYIFGWIGRDKIATNFVNSIQTYFQNVDIKNYILDNLEKYAGIAINVDLPENVDGTTPYNPFAFPLISTVIFDMLTAPPNGIFPPQIPWPTDYLTAPCNKSYNGNAMLFTYRRSDSCTEENGYDYPFCPHCDYCRPTYSTCNAIGFKDFFDSILYVIMAIPKILVFYFEDGILITTLDLWLPLIVFFVSLIYDYPMTPVYVILVYFILWFLYIFGYTVFTYASIVSVLYILIMQLIPGTIYQLPAVITLMSILSSLQFIDKYIYSLRFAEEIRPIAWAITSITAIDDIITFINFKPLLAKLEVFDIPAGDNIPSVYTFCFFFTFGNIALAGVVLVIVLPFAYLGAMFILNFGLFSQSIRINTLEIINDLKSAILSFFKRLKGSDNQPVSAIIRNEPLLPIEKKEN